MTCNIGLTDEAKPECAVSLSKVLSETFVLYLKTHNFHWNVESPRFLGLHEMFEEQYRDLWNSIDDIAERIRALGQPAPGTTAKLKELAEIKESERIPAATEMLRELISDNETARRTIRPRCRSLRTRVTRRPLDCLQIASPITKSKCG